MLISKAAAITCADVALSAAKRGMVIQAIKCPTCRLYILDDDHEVSRFLHHQCAGCGYVYRSPTPCIANPLAVLHPSIDKEGGFLTFPHRHSGIRFYPTPRLPPPIFVDVHPHDGERVAEVVPVQVDALLAVAKGLDVSMNYAARCINGALLARASRVPLRIIACPCCDGIVLDEVFPLTGTLKECRECGKVLLDAKVAANPLAGLVRF